MANPFEQGFYCWNPRFPRPRLAAASPHYPGTFAESLGPDQIKRFILAVDQGISNLPRMAWGLFPLEKSTQHVLTASYPSGTAFEPEYISQMILVEGHVALPASRMLTLFRNRALPEIDLAPADRAQPTPARLFVASDDYRASGGRDRALATLEALRQADALNVVWYAIDAILSGCIAIFPPDPVARQMPEDIIAAVELLLPPVLSIQCALIYGNVPPRSLRPHPTFAIIPRAFAQHARGSFRDDQIWITHYGSVHPDRVPLSCHCTALLEEKETQIDFSRLMDAVAEADLLDMAQVDLPSNARSYPELDDALCQLYEHNLHTPPVTWFDWVKRVESDVDTLRLLPAVTWQGASPEQIRQLTRTWLSGLGSSPADLIRLVQKGLIAQLKSTYITPKERLWDLIGESVIASEFERLLATINPTQIQLIARCMMAFSNDATVRHYDALLTSDLPEPVFNALAVQSLSCMVACGLARNLKIFQLYKLASPGLKAQLDNLYREAQAVNRGSHRLEWSAILPVLDAIFTEYGERDATWQFFREALINQQQVANPANFVCYLAWHPALERVLMDDERFKRLLNDSFESATKSNSAIPGETREAVRTYIESSLGASFPLAFTLSLGLKTPPREIIAAIQLWRAAEEEVPSLEVILETILCDFLLPLEPPIRLQTWNQIADLWDEEAWGTDAWFRRYLTHVGTSDLDASYAAAQDLIQIAENQTAVEPGTLLRLLDAVMTGEAAVSPVDALRFLWQDLIPLMIRHELPLDANIVKNLATYQPVKKLSALWQQYLMEVFTEVSPVLEAAKKWSAAKKLGSELLSEAPLARVVLYLYLRKTTRLDQDDEQEANAAIYALLTDLSLEEPETLPGLPRLLHLINLIQFYEYYERPAIGRRGEFGERGKLDLLGQEYAAERLSATGCLHVANRLLEHLGASALTLSDVQMHPLIRVWVAGLVQKGVPLAQTLTAPLGAASPHGGTLPFGKWLEVRHPDLMARLRSVPPAGTPIDDDAMQHTLIAVIRELASMLGQTGFQTAWLLDLAVVFYHPAPLSPTVLLGLIDQWMRVMSNWTGTATETTPHLAIAQWLPERLYACLSAMVCTGNLTPKTAMEAARSGEGSTLLGWLLRTGLAREIWVHLLDPTQPPPPIPFTLEHGRRLVAPLIGRPLRLDEGLALADWCWRFGFRADLLVQVCERLPIQEASAKLVYDRILEWAESAISGDIPWLLKVMEVCRIAPDQRTSILANVSTGCVLNREFTRRPLEISGLFKAFKAGEIHPNVWASLIRRLVAEPGFALAEGGDLWNLLYTAIDQEARDVLLGADSSQLARWRSWGSPDNLYMQAVTNAAARLREDGKNDLLEYRARQLLESDMILESDLIRGYPWQELHPSDRDTFKIGIWGGKGFGKTTYLAMLYFALENDDAWRVTYRRGDATERFMWDIVAPLHDSMENPASTSPGEGGFYRFIIRSRNPVHSTPGKPRFEQYFLTFLDAPGECYEDPDRSDCSLEPYFPPGRALYTSIIEYLSDCQGIIFLIDPTQLTVGNRKASYYTMLHNLLQRLGQQQHTWEIPQFIAFTVTKVDRPGLWERRQHTNQILHDILGADIADLMKGWQRSQYASFSVSARGIKPGVKGQPLSCEPYNTIAPLEWLIDQFKGYGRQTGGNV